MPIVKSKTKKQLEDEEKRKQELASQEDAAGKTEQQRKDEGNTYVREREKTASQLGISSKAAAKLMVPGEEEALIKAIQAKKTQGQAQDIGGLTEQLNQPVMQKVPTGLVDELGNPVSVDVPISQVPNNILSGQETNPVEAGGALAAGGAAALGGAAIGTKLGALAAPVTGGASIPVGATIGAVVGFIGGAFGKVALDEHQNVKELKEAFTDSKTNLNTIKDLVKANPSYRDQALIDWRTEKENIYRLEQVLKSKTNNVLDEFLGDPGDEYEEVKAYMRVLPQMEQEFLIARASSGI